MSENTPGHSQHEPARSEIELSLSGQQFIEDHFRFRWHATVGGPLSEVADHVVLVDLPEQAAVDPDLQASVMPYTLPSRVTPPFPEN